jgi:hypothetical protein
MSDLLDSSQEGKPLAGNCKHVWQNQKSPFLIAQVCQHCKLFRYKSSLRADWEYRAPIPIAPIPGR